MNREAVLRIPPHSEEAEVAALGSLLVDARAWERLELSGEDFYANDHRLIHAAMSALYSAGKPVDVVTVYHQLGAEAERVGGLAYLNSLAQSVPLGGGAKRYAAIVREQAVLRRVIGIADHLATSAFNPDGKAVDAIVDEAQMALSKLTTAKRKRDPQHILDSLPAYLDLLHDLSEGKNPAISTGIGGLDRLMNGGHRRGAVMVLGARPKHGKTALALAMARAMARSRKVLFLSQEMPVSELMHRHTAAAGTLELSRILRADPNDHELWERLPDVARRLGDLHLIHDDQCALTLMDIRRKVMQVRRQYGLDVLFVDFLQLMQGAGEDTRNQELDAIVNGLKALALELDICVVALSQMNRKADEHYGPPTMTHLRDSGAIEAAADAIVLLFTDHAHPQSKKTSDFAGFSQLEIVAHRNGPQGTVPLEFRAAYQQFGDWMGRIPQHERSSKRGME